MFRPIETTWSQSPLIGAVFLTEEDCPHLLLLEDVSIPSNRGSVSDRSEAVNHSASAAEVSIPSNRGSVSDKTDQARPLSPDHYVSIPSNRGSVSDLSRSWWRSGISFKSQSPLIGAVFLTEGARYIVSGLVLVSIPSNRGSVSDLIKINHKVMLEPLKRSQSPLIGAVFLTASPAPVTIRGVQGLNPL
ncbi:hypothetical protein MTBBW1_2790005 [Desulfamplus magnetovallimortis]|uniref:Uncharacterized protein n=1 Tax=Desulfamplus magnetovallimortis TaxID=1246637 RepID=A0A1W1HFG3_9BACT|nr:hypothetical protein MTBBW1_2790005 [Desulfamplus magnetovallimortis]